jgi:hypothetical protein
MSEGLRGSMILQETSLLPVMAVELQATAKE